MLHDAARHEVLKPVDWNAQRAAEAIERIASDARGRYTGETLWPFHPKDLAAGDDPAQPATPLYHGAAGVVWALQYLHDVGAATSDARDIPLEPLLERNGAWLAASMPGDETAAYLMGDTPLLMMLQGRQPAAGHAERLARCIEGNLDHPARELMWGSPGTMLAALFLHQRFGHVRWAEAFRRTAARLRSQLVYSDAHGCHHWTQDLYGRRYTFLDAVHGFVATAGVLLRGRHLLEPAEWAFWQGVIIETVSKTATHDTSGVNWRVELLESPARTGAHLMQFCHGAPGFVVWLADFPGSALDDLLVRAGEAVWAAGPLTKGSNLCHGTGGNGYAFLKLHRRTGETRWLERARAFAMHGLAQMEADEREHGRLRYSLWTGDLGFAIYLHDCLHATASFPTVDAFYAPPAP
jgi:hypothetical protein